jgi:hypothetical protein
MKHRCGCAFSDDESLPCVATPAELIHCKHAQPYRLLLSDGELLQLLRAEAAPLEERR